MVFTVVRPFGGEIVNSLERAELGSGDGAPINAAWAMTAVPEQEKSVRRIQSAFVNTPIASWEQGKDRRGPERLQNNILAWTAALENCDPGGWCGVLQDDVILCDDFESRAGKRLKEASAGGMGVVSFHSWLKAIPEVYADGGRWHRQPPKRFRNQQALAMSSDVAERFLTEAREMVTDYRYFDVLIADALSLMRVPVWHTVPSLVDHDLSMKSTIGHARRVFGIPRSSKCFRKDAP